MSNTHYNRLGLLRLEFYGAHEKHVVNVIIHDVHTNAHRNCDAKILKDCAYLKNTIKKEIIYGAQMRNDVKKRLFMASILLTY